MQSPCFRALATPGRRALLQTLAAGAALLARPAMAATTAATGDGDAIGTLADHMLGIRHADVPPAILAVTRSQLFDAMGVALAAGEEAGVAQLKSLAGELGGKAESRVWGSTLRIPAQDAARINAVMVHALEYDDTYGRGYLHPAAIIFPAALAAADMVGGVSGREFLTATSAAIDIACRLSIAGQPGRDGFATGWHNTTIIGYPVAAMVAGRLMGLDRERLIHAVGIACHQAAGNAQSHIDGALTKRMGPGFASAAGLFAARLAALGVTGPRGVLEGEKGWFRQYHGGVYSRELLLDGLGRSFAATGVSFKPWPSCRGSHSSADAALQLVKEYRLTPDRIARIRVRNGPAEWPFLCNPIEQKRRPRSTVEAQFSIPWVVAAAFADGRLSLDQFTGEALRRADILAMADRVNALQDDSLANPLGGPGQAVVEVDTMDGRHLFRHVSVTKGDPQAPMSAAETTAKFEDCAAHGGLPATRIANLRRMLERVDELDDISRLGAATIPA